MKLKVFFYTSALIPFAFVYAHPSSCMAGKTTIGKMIRWVGKDHVEMVFWKLSQNLQAITEIEGESFFLMVRSNHGEIFPGRGERIRTSDSRLPKAVLYQAELHPDEKSI